MLALLANVVVANLRMDPERFEAKALEQTPLGSSMDDVLTEIDANYRERPYKYQKCNSPAEGPGEYSYSVKAASHWIAPVPIIEYVFVSWCFNEAGNLRSVEALKVGDGL